MLLSHTAGFGYSFFNPKLIDWAGPRGLDEFSGSYQDYLTQPLVNQPGTKWEYGINIDWAGQLVERVSGLKLNDYFQQHIFKPMHLTNITMFPTDAMKEKLAYMNTRDTAGNLALNVNGHLNRRPLYATDPKEVETTFHQGGAGVFAVPREYAQVVAVLLNDGVHAPTGARILKEETVKEMFTNQIPDMPDFARQGISPPKPLLANPTPELYPEDPSIPQGWGLTFFLHLRDSAVHGEGTGWWAGLPNLFWWADRKRGIGGIIASQIIPFGDMKVLGLWAQLEAGILQNLQ
jgi:CubicO group peptidase (beta-lactamase class C family)